VSSKVPPNPNQSDSTIKLGWRRVGRQQLRGKTERGPTTELAGREGAAHPVIIGAVDVPGHAEVPDLHHQLVTHQAVAGGQVAVDEVEGGEVDHARCDLRGDLQHVAQRQLPAPPLLPLLQHLGVGAVGPAGAEGLLGAGGHTYGWGHTRMGGDTRVGGGTHVWVGGHVWGRGHVWVRGHIWVGTHTYRRGDTYGWGDTYEWGHTCGWGHTHIGWGDTYGAGGHVWVRGHVWGGGVGIGARERVPEAGEGLWDGCAQVCMCVQGGSARVCA